MQFNLLILVPDLNFQNTPLWKHLQLNKSLLHSSSSSWSPVILFLLSHPHLFTLTVKAKPETPSLLLKSIITSLGRVSREANGTPLQYSCLENPMDGGAWWAAVHAKGQTRLSDFTFTFHFHALEKEMATHSSVLAWRIPRMGEPGGLPSMGSHRVRHGWSDLAAAAERVSLSSGWTLHPAASLLHL